jgi:hypothetical protein
MGLGESFHIENFLNCSNSSEKPLENKMRGEEKDE